ncbi:MAG: hypothetical protein ACLQKA_21040 [Bryobacteraceae bacterium]
MIEATVYYLRMTLGMRELLRQPVMADPIAALRFQMEHREEHFLDLARQIVFSNPHHPYYEMFRIAGCTAQDLVAEVGRSGLEPALEKLVAAGVYLTHDEFKGKVPLIRGGREIPYAPHALLNPLVRGRMMNSSSGSRSSGTMTPANTKLQSYQEAYFRLAWREFGLDGRTSVQMLPILPSLYGIGYNIWHIRSGLQPAKWFAQRGSGRGAARYRTLTDLIVLSARLMGAPLPLPDYLPENDFSPVARWIAQRNREGTRCVMFSFVSSAVRVAAAARDENLDIAGTTFLVGGEALTDAKRAGMEAAGCEAHSKYNISEVGGVGIACRHMRTGNSVHVHRDAVAVVSRRRRAPLSDVEVNSLLFTNLLPFAAWFLINAEMDDAGILEPVDCDCEYSRAGMNQRIRDMYSYGKLTGQGITLLGGDIAHILESALPKRFGGGPGDYQLVEYDGARQSQVELRISPRVSAVPPAEVRDFLLQEIRGCYGGTIASRVWTHSGGLGAVVAEPFATQTGKVLPLHLLGSKVEAPRAT